jgi:hypothetical protein
MKTLIRTLGAIQLFVLIATAETPIHKYTGNIVNARCTPAAEIISRNSRGYAPSGIAVSALKGTAQSPLRTGRAKKAILQHCSVNPGVTEFALLDESGNFFLLNEAGNLKVVLHQIPSGKDSSVTIEGYVDHATLYVRSLSKGLGGGSGAAAR